MPDSIPPTCRPPRSDPAQHGLKLNTANQKRRTKTTLFSRHIKNLRSVQLLLGKGGTGGAHRNTQHTGWFGRRSGRLPNCLVGVIFLFIDQEIADVCLLLEREFRWRQAEQPVARNATRQKPPVPRLPWRGS